MEVTLTDLNLSTITSVSIISEPESNTRNLENDIAVLIGVLGIAFNALCLKVFLTKKYFGDIPQTIVINQCTTDFLAGICLIYSQYHSLYLGVEIPEGVGNPHLYCSIIHSTYLMWGFMQVSSWNLQVLNIERYVSICHPVTHQKYCTRRVIILVTIAVWIAGFAYQGIFATFNKYIDEDEVCIFSPPNQLASAAYAVGFFTHTLVLPILVMAICYLRMFITLRNRIGSFRRDAAGDKQQEIQKVVQTRKFVITCGMMNIAYVLCLSWNSIYYFLQSIEVIKYQTESAFYIFTVLMVFCNCFVNPIIYFTKMKPFRIDILNVVTCGCWKNMNSVASDSHANTAALGESA